MNNHAICTIASLNYFSQAVSLVKNIKSFHKNVDLHILIVDKPQQEEVREHVRQYEEFAEIAYVSEIGIKDFHKMASIYDVVELNTAVKPFYLDYLLDHYHYDTIMYIDPDILLFHDLTEVYSDLHRYSIILTPHLISEEEDVDTKISKLDDFLQYGIYNLGFIALKNDESSRKLIAWWEKQLRWKCFLNPSKFLAWDQKWMDFAPALFNHVYILRDPGYNVAFWNIQRRFVSKKEGQYFVNETNPLVFYHFSHYHLERKDRIATVESEARCTPIGERPDLQELFDAYYTSVMNQEYSYFSKIPYGFEQCTNGRQRKKEEPFATYLQGDAALLV